MVCSLLIISVCVMDNNLVATGNIERMNCLYYSHTILGSFVFCACCIQSGSQLFVVYIMLTTSSGVRLGSVSILCGPWLFLPPAHKRLCTRSCSVMTLLAIRTMLALLPFVIVFILSILFTFPCVINVCSLLMPDILKVDLYQRSPFARSHSLL